MTALVGRKDKSMKKILIISLMALVLIADDANKAINPTEIIEVQKKAIEFINSDELIEEQINNFAKKLNIEFGIEDKKGRTFYQGKATVSVKPSNAQWGKWRTVAYQKAFYEAKSTFIQNELKIQTKESFENYSDDSDNAQTIPKSAYNTPNSAAAVIWEKVKKLVGAKLDKALEEYDIDPSEFKQAPEIKKKALFKNNYAQKILQKASGNLSGLMTIKSFESIDNKGFTTIGVIVMYNESLKDLAYDINHKREPFLTSKKGKSIDNIISNDKKELSNSFGIRLAFNQDGSPIIISYGQWSASYHGENEKRKRRAIKHAKEQATAKSKAQIANFLDSVAKWEASSITNAKDEENIEYNANDIEDTGASQTTTEMIDKHLSKMTTKSNVTIRGLSNYKTSLYKHKLGHNIVTVITIWTQKNAERAVNIRNYKPKHHTKKTIVKKQLVSENIQENSEGAGMELDF